MNSFTCEAIMENRDSASQFSITDRLVTFPGLMPPTGPPSTRTETSISPPPCGNQGIGHERDWKIHKHSEALHPMPGSLHKKRPHWSNPAKQMLLWKHYGTLLEKNGTVRSAAGGDPTAPCPENVSVLHGVSHLPAMKPAVQVSRSHTT